LNANAAEPVSILYFIFCDIPFTWIANCLYWSIVDRMIWYYCSVTSMGWITWFLDTLFFYWNLVFGPSEICTCSSRRNYVCFERRNLEIPRDIKCVFIYWNNWPRFLKSPWCTEIYSDRWPRRTKRCRMISPVIWFLTRSKESDVTKILVRQPVKGVKQILRETHWYTHGKLKV